MSSAPENVAATITAHHLLMNRNAIFAGGIRPHHYCLPVLKREPHRLALVKAAMSGNPRFFLGTDTAPHARAAKESCCGSAGMYTAHAAMELYCEVFEREGALDKLEGFASRFGPDFYGLPRNTRDGDAGEAAVGGARGLSLRRRRPWCRCAPASASPGASRAERAADDHGLGRRAGSASRRRCSRRSRRPSRGSIPRRWPTHEELTALAEGIVTVARHADSLRGAARRRRDEGRPYYELHIAESGEVETRPDNWHDLFNALAWIAFPKAKAAINAQHAAMLAEGGEEEARRRSPARDALTLFDEGGVVVASSSPALLRLIVDFEWKELFWHRREELAREGALHRLRPFALREDARSLHRHRREDGVRAGERLLRDAAAGVAGRPRPTRSSRRTSPAARASPRPGRWRRCRCWASRAGIPIPNASPSTTTSITSESVRPEHPGVLRPVSP